VTTAAIVLAGGASRRFGGPKLTAELDGKPLLAHAVDIALGAADRVLVVVGPDDATPAIDGIEVARDGVAHGGPLAGLLAGLDALDGTADSVIVLAGDMPSVHPEVLALLVEWLSSAPGVDAVHLEADPVATLPLAARAAVIGPTARALLAADRRSLRALLDAVASDAVTAARWRAIDPSGSTLRDIDTRADLGRP
jgi:molybdopterin-guanine dinucleotide biosynthesis protein A